MSVLPATGRPAGVAVKAGIFSAMRSFMLLAGAALLSQLAGCAGNGGVQGSCRVLDPDLAQGAYRGGCQDGLADGYGEVRGAGSYRGDFLAGRKHGRGIKVMPNGDRYAGDFSDDYRHGKGLYVWGSNTPWAGDRYEGEYRRDLRHGHGVFLWGSGDRYEGMWQDDQRLGPSVMELRRAQAAAAVEARLAIGAAVCTETRVGLVNRQRIVATVEDGAAGQGMRIRIAEVEGGMASYRGGMVKVGDMLAVDAAEWRPCAR